MPLSPADRLVLAGAMCVAPAWLRSRRRAYRAESAPLGRHERSAFQGFFEVALLDAVRVARVDEFRPWPAERLLSRCGLRGLLASEFVAGIALIDTVVLVNPAVHARRISPLSLLFHELVHIAQYRRLGVNGFLRAYIGGWLENDRSYADIPLEVEAYELTERYDREPGRPFPVRGALGHGG